MTDDQGLLRDRFADARVAHLATASTAAVPHLAPICFAVRGDALYFAVDRKPKSGRELKRIRNLRQNPRVAVLVDHYDEDWGRLWWMRADGSAAEISDPVERAAALALLQAKYPQYRDEPPPGPYVRVAIDNWLSWHGG